MNRRFEIIVPIATPYRVQGDVDREALRAHAAVLAESGVDGFFVAGTNGEGPLLSDDEVVAAIGAVRAGGGDLKVIAQAGRAGTEASRVLLARAIAAGADAVAAVTPYYYDLGPEQALEHYGRLIEAAGDVALLAYVIPSHARNDLSPECVRELAARGLAGIKDSTRSLERHRAYVAIADMPGNAEFATFVGSDTLVLAALELGSHGAITALTNARPRLFVDLVAAAAAGDDAGAIRLQEQIARERDELHAAGTSIKQAISQLMATRGIAYSSSVRAPLAAAATAQRT